MIDSRVAELAKMLIEYSCALQPGENILIEAHDMFAQPELITALVDEVYKAGGNPFVEMRSSLVQNRIVTGGKDEQLNFMAEYESLRMRNMQAYIGVRGGFNSYEMANVPAEQMRKYTLLVSEPVHSLIRVKNTKWAVMRWPSAAMAQMAGMTTPDFEDFYFSVCNFDYSKMSKAMDSLVDRMQKTDKVRLVGPGTDLSFSIKGIPAIKCDGKLNIPDGEVFTAPHRESMNGKITYNTFSIYRGKKYDNICFEIENGKIVKATGDDSKGINDILDTDAGARYFGEFAIGVHPYITRPLGDTLFDEKISGSIHLTPGECYDEAPNGNKSAVHWDLVLMQTPEYGGGEIYFDDCLVRKDGLFVTEDLKCLNPDELK